MPYSFLPKPTKDNINQRDVKTVKKFVKNNQDGSCSAQSTSNGILRDKKNEVKVLKDQSKIRDKSDKLLTADSNSKVQANASNSRSESRFGFKSKLLSTSQHKNTNAVVSEPLPPKIDNENVDLKFSKQNALLLDNKINSLSLNFPQVSNVSGQTVDDVSNVSDAISITNYDVVAIPAVQKESPDILCPDHVEIAPAIYGTLDDNLFSEDANSITSPNNEDVFLADVTLKHDQLESSRFKRSSSGPKNDINQPLVHSSRHSSVGDDQQIVMDGTVYRHLTCELMVMKTMLLKLKRTIQDNEASSSLSSQPCTPQLAYPEKTFDNGSNNNYSTAERPKSFLSPLPLVPRTLAMISMDTGSWACSSPSSSPVRSVDQLMMENRLLKQQVSNLQQTLSDNQLMIDLVNATNEKTSSSVASTSKVCAEVAVQTEQTSCNKVKSENDLRSQVKFNKEVAIGGFQGADRQKSVETVKLRTSKIARKNVQSAVYNS